MSGKAVRETMGFLAVVAGLVFVGVELRQNTAAQRSETRQAMADAAQEFSLRVAESPTLSRVWTDFLSGAGDVPLSRVDSIQARGVTFALLRQVENVYLQYVDGPFDESILATYGFTGGVWRLPGFIEYWNSSTYQELWDPGFLRAFEAANDLR